MNFTGRHRRAQAPPPPKEVRRDRIVRLVDDDSMAAQGLVCSFDAAKNILRIERSLYETLAPRQQTEVWRSRASVIITRKGNTA